MRSPFTVEVVRSERRKKTVSARLIGDVVRVQMPAWVSKEEEVRYVSHFLGRIERQQQRAPVDVMQRATRLATRLDLPQPVRVRWVSNQQSLWGSCTIATRDIRVSDRLAGFPEWVLDYVLVHELAHLAEPNHSKRFWSLVNRYARAERARGFLIAKGMETDESEEPANEPADEATDLG
jgi:predicted metal-dependent hydrolase